MKYCANCGAELGETAKFCENCGAPIPPAQPEPEAPAQGAYAPPAPDPFARTAGYATNTDSPEILRVLKKTKRTTLIWSVVLVLAPFVGFLIYGAVSDKMEIGTAAFYGLVISAIFLLAALITAIKKKFTKPFEGAVARKKTVRRSGDVQQRGGKSRTKHLVWFTLENGKQRKKEVTPAVFSYLNEGDRVRFLPQFPQPYEKYDKSNGETMCVFCGRVNPLSQDTCAFCHNPLLK